MNASEGEVNCDSLLPAGCVAVGKSCLFRWRAKQAHGYHWDALAAPVPGPCWRKCGWPQPSAPLGAAAAVGKPLCPRTVPFPELPTAKDCLWEEYKGPAVCPQPPAPALPPPAPSSTFPPPSSPLHPPQGSSDGRCRLQSSGEVKALLGLITVGWLPPLQLPPSSFHRCWFSQNNLLVNPTSAGSVSGPYVAGRCIMNVVLVGSEDSW